ncbi:MAG: glycosyltransferase family 4 protein, partial [Candidatus Omnitrophota bacterium]|nr:glycosyltransferase family 4 protein [Candidatus Omnitrophota bacterium]
TKCEFAPGVFASFFKLLPLVRKYKIDIIHCNTRVTQVTGCLLSKYSSRPYVSTCHGFFKARRLSRRIFPCWGNKVIAISQEVKEHLLNDFKVDEKNIAVINHGIDINRFVKVNKEQGFEARKSYGLPAEAGVIGIVARLSDVKGHIYLIRAMPDILKNHPSALLWIIGDGKMLKELTALVDKLKIKDKVVFRPEARDTAGALAAMDIFVMPSLKEGLGLALMEAMAAGLAVVGSSVGGIKTLVQDGESGLLVPAANSAELAQKVSSLLADPAMARRLGDNARDSIAAKFAFESMITDTERLYSACLNQKD